MARSGLLLFTVLILFLGGGVAECHRHGHGGRRELQVSRLGSLTDEAGPWNGFKALLDAQLGEVHTGLAGLKSYLLQFGYLNSTDSALPFTDSFDNVTQRAIMNYQRSFGLSVTGRLDVATLTQMIVPRCGREDVINGTLLMLQNGLSPNATATQHLGVQHYASFPGSPRWKKQNLTYAINSAALSPDVSLVDTEIAIDTAFATWAAAITLSFVRIQSLALADITVSFDALDHGDGNAFDGQFGVLAHAFAPSDGRLHFDQQESWTVNINRATATLGDFDLASVAVHEIGHILGLEHSAVPEAIMYPSISALTTKRTLSADDVAGAQALYGANPNPTPAGTPPGPDGVGNQGNNAAVAAVAPVDVVTVAALAAFVLMLTS